MDASIIASHFEAAAAADDWNGSPSQAQLAAAPDAVPERITNKRESPSYGVQYLVKFHFDQVTPQWTSNGDCPLWAIKEYEAQVRKEAKQFWWRDFDFHPAPASPPPRTKRTRLVPTHVLNGHVSSLPAPSATRRVPRTHVPTVLT